MLSQAEGWVSKFFIQDTEISPDVLTSLSDDEMKRMQKSNRQFSQLCDDMMKIYSASFEAGFRIERYKFGGFWAKNQRIESSMTGL